jgi:hypothetical protein
MNVVLAMSGFTKSDSNSNRRRALEKARIQKLKSWHENVKKIAKSEVDFIASIFMDDKDSENRDWLRTDDEDVDEKGDGALVKKDS